MSPIPRREHHFVPQFYLRFFASIPPRQIHLLLLDRNLAVPDVSLRNQCRKPGLYGVTNEIEDSLAMVEGQHMAPVLRSIVKGGNLPRPRSCDHEDLLIFVAFQMQRTPAAASVVNVMTDKGMKQIWSRYAKAKGINLDDFTVGYERAVSVSLSFALEGAQVLDDLEMLLLQRAEGAPAFITSDNPVVRHNEWVPGTQGIGLGMRGAQVFVPLSSQFALMLYDKPVYKIRGHRRSGDPLTVNAKDIDALNFAQAVYAEKCLLFSEWDAVERIRQLAKKATPYRRRETVFVDEFPEVGNEQRSSLLVSSVRGRISTLNLSFISIKRRMRKVAPNDRWWCFRRLRPTDSEQSPAHGPPEHKVFAKPVRRRGRASG